MATNHFNKLTESQAERLALIIEECAEVQQIACKVLRHGYHSFNPYNNEGPNYTLLEKEVGDLLLVIQMAVDSGDLVMERVDSALKRKAKKIIQYLHHQPVKDKQEDRCLCGGRGCNTCEPQGRG